MARNARGEGSVRQLPDGSWECVIQSKYLIRLFVDDIL